MTRSSNQNNEDITKFLTDNRSKIISEVTKKNANAKNPQDLVFHVSLGFSFHIYYLTKHLNSQDYESELISLLMKYYDYRRANIQK